MQSKKAHTLVYYYLSEGIVTTEETNAGEGVTHAIDDIDTDESKNEKRKSRAKSVTLKDEGLARSNSGKLYNVTHVRTRLLAVCFSLEIQQGL